MITEKEFCEVVRTLTPQQQHVIFEFVKQKDHELVGLELEIEDLTKPRRRRREED